MDIIWQEFFRGMPDGSQFLLIAIRLIAAGLVGALIGYEREHAGKSAGLRTHVLVILGTCLFVLTGTVSGMTSDGVSRVIQGIATGIGFIGAGSILKLNEEHHIRGLTTAAGIFMTAAIGVCIGVGMIGLAVVAAVITLIVLAVLRRFETKDDDGAGNKR
jgi:putative Mg2+ transporter-C (MgtC) family protein